MLLTESLLGSSSTAANYIEDVFSTYLYTGTGSAQTITNGIDLSGKGGLVWMKDRTAGVENHQLMDTARGNDVSISSNSTAGNDPGLSSYFTFNNNGFSFPISLNRWNQSGNNYASWTFREQPKFFDIVTYTGNGANRTIAHNLGSVPGCIMIKRTDTTGAWAVYHRSLANTQYTVLNTTAAAATGATYWNSTTPTSSVFSLGTATDVNASGGTYVAYLFAHDAGGFGAAGTDNVISCGSVTVSNADAVATLGWEPQLVLYKQIDGVGAWTLTDNMRGLGVSLTANNSAILNPNNANAEATNNGPALTSTGFVLPYAGGAAHGNGTYIYIAIRRGPMKTPTSGTSVFGLNARTGTGANATVTGGQTDDAVLTKNRGSAVASLFSSRLTGTGYLVTSSTAAEVAAGTTILQANPWDVMDGVKVGTTSTITNASANTFINYLFRRAPGFFDVVCYTGDGVVGRTISHNLGVAPEFMIIRARNNGANWAVYSGSPTSYMFLNSNAGSTTSSGYWNNTAPSASVFTVGGVSAVNVSAAYTYVAYLFATCPGVSKVGSYTGSGTTKQIDCGFTGGARLVLIKRTDSTGDWYLWDTARGIVAGNDPYLLVNSTAAESTATDYVDTYSAGFEISSTAPAAINASGGTFIFLAIA